MGRHHLTRALGLLALLASGAAAQGGPGTCPGVTLEYAGAARCVNRAIVNASGLALTGCSGTMCTLDTAAAVSRLGSCIGDVNGEICPDFDHSGGSTLRVPTGTAPTVSAAGAVAVDTSAPSFVTQPQLLAYGGALAVLDPVRVVCARIQNATASDTDIEVLIPHSAATVVGVSCRCQGTCTPTLGTWQLEDRAGNAMTGTPTCTTDTSASAWATVSGAHAALAAGEGLSVSVTNTPSVGGTYLVCAAYTVGRR